jgi:hypothetical protein
MTDGLGLGLCGLEGETLGLGALLACNRNNQPFLGLGRQWVWSKTACQMVNCGDLEEDGYDSLVDGACSQRWRE